jgi:hypothetical protein
MPEQQPAPQMLIRRFDIFAEWNRLKGRTRKHMKEADARAYGLAVAKVVASRKLHGAEPEEAKELKRQAREDQTDEPWWEHLGSYEEFEHKIIERMGRAFYRQVFQPAIRQAWDDGQKYEEIRDKLREPWNKERSSSSRASQRSSSKAQASHQRSG